MYDDESRAYKAREGLTEEQLKNLGNNMVKALHMSHVTLEVEDMKRSLEPKDKQDIIIELAKTLTDEQVRESILSLQKMLCNR